MTNEVVALASKADGETLSELQVHHISAWDYGSRQWNVALPEGSLLTMCAFNDMFAVATIHGGAHYEEENDEPQFETGEIHMF
ncbi:unnamed protein product [Gongylonema pulchrum]|uniref:Mcl1_mid domain-containing protein n=1 Tax=Gongylonema pulchrum TaxID=637853 RepID=A0A183EPP3_9BILA|nr:unnamed protein product [Gongylonema pulchrum]